MHLNSKTLEELRNLINEKTEYRSGPKLVSFFNQLGFNDTYNYGQGFPSRWMYTDEKLNQINGKPELDKCIKLLFDPINYIGRYTDLDNFISEFNEYLSYDGWRVVRNNKEITFERVRDYDVDAHKSEEVSQDEAKFLNQNYVIKVDQLNIPTSLQPIINERLEEINKCMIAQCPLAAIFLSGSTLEGILLSLATSYPKSFNQANSAPIDKKTGSKKKFDSWSLKDYIDVAYELGYLREDVKKFSHVLRDFRNYIHPYEQMTHKFNPDIHTAEICFQVLKAAIYQVCNNK
jgi:hypothetical protein